MVVQAKKNGNGSTPAGALNKFIKKMDQQINVLTDIEYMEKKSEWMENRSTAGAVPVKDLFSISIEMVLVILTRQTAPGGAAPDLQATASADDLSRIG